MKSSGYSAAIGGKKKGMHKGMTKKHASRAQQKIPDYAKGAKMKGMR